MAPLPPLKHWLLSREPRTHEHVYCQHPTWPTHMACQICGFATVKAGAEYILPPCPACSGRGWQSDAMPPSDGKADVDTVWLNAPTLREEMSK